jgi:hypothetical protein
VWTGCGFGSRPSRWNCLVRLSSTGKAGTVTLRAKQLPDFRTAYLVSLPHQFACKCARTLTSPTKRRTRIATRTRLNQRFQSLNQLRLFDFTGSATTARTFLFIAGRCVGIIKLLNSRTDCSVRDAGSFGNPPVSGYIRGSEHSKRSY